MKKLFCGFFLTLILAGFITDGKANSRKIVLQLKWKHQFQFAGYYAALEKGYYAEVGLEVEIREQELGQSSVQEVISGNAHYGVANVELIGHYMMGEPVVLIASIFQHSPSIFIVKEASGIYNPHDLIGKRIMLETDERRVELISMLNSEGVKAEQLVIVDHTQSINDFLTNRIDALSAYITNEPFFLESFGIPYRIISPRTYGIDFYSDCLFTSKDEIRKNPERVKLFLEASLRGWEYALNNKEEIATLIISKYNPSKSYQQLIYEANEIHKLINPELVEIGHTNKGRWESMANFLYQQGLIDKPSNFDDFFYPGASLYKYDWKKILRAAAFLVLLIGLFTLISYLRARQFIIKRTKDYQALVSKLEEQNAHITAINDELMKAREAAEENLKDKSTFFAGLISELKSPVDLMLEASNRLKTEKLKVNEKVTLHLTIEESARALKNFTKDIVSIFSIDTSKEKISYEEVNPKNLLHSFKDVCPHRTGCNPNQVIVNEVDPKMSISILIDQEKVFRILEILVSNSLKHTKGVNVELGVSQQEVDTLTFWVKDSGIGLYQKQVEQFNLFFSDQNKSFIKGVGYGLTLVKALVSLLEGSLWVASNGSKGTTFFIKIPYITLDRLSYNFNVVSSLGIDLTEGKAEKLKSKNILIYDHHPNNYLLTRTMLEGVGCSLIFTDSIDKTLSLCIGYKDLSLLIINVSVISNLELDAISEIRRFSTDIIVIANVLYEIEQRDKYIKLGFTDIIQRPNTRVQLVSRIIEFLGE